MGRSSATESAPLAAPQQQDGGTPLSKRWRVSILLLLLLFGIELWLLSDRRLVRRPFELITIAVLIGFSLLPPVRTAIEATRVWLNARRGFAVAMFAATILIVSCAYFLATSIRQEKQLIPL